jgi:hypothetical protein
VGGKKRKRNRIEVRKEGHFMPCPGLMKRSCVGKGVIMPLWKVEISSKASSDRGMRNELF